MLPVEGALAVWKAYRKPSEHAGMVESLESYDLVILGGAWRSRMLKTSCGGSLGSSKG